MRALCSFSLLSLALFASHSAAADEFPNGTFTLKLDGMLWAFTFDGMGKYKYTLNGKERGVGKYKATKDEVALTDIPPPGFNGPKELTATGTYKWKLDGRKLTFTVVKDDNKARVEIATAGPWEKKE